jgi:hypothetical protein
MKAGILALLAVVVAPLSFGGIVPNDYKALIIASLKKRSVLTEDGTYRIQFTQPAYACLVDPLGRPTKKIVGVVDFIVLFRHRPEKNSIWVGGSTSEHAVFGEAGDPTFGVSVDWLFGQPEWDPKSEMAIDNPKGKENRLSNQSTDPAPGSVTPVAGQPPRQP